MPSRRDRVDADRVRRRVGLEFLGDHHVDRQHDLAAAAFGLGQDAPRGVGISLSTSDLPTSCPARAGRCSPWRRRSPARRPCSTDCRAGRAWWRPWRRRRWPPPAASACRAPVQRLQLRLHQPAGIGRQHVAKPFGRGMRAVRGGESVVDADVAELGQRRDEGRIVLLLARVEARVLQQRMSPAFSAATAASAFGADAVIDERDRPLERSRDRVGHRPERLLRVARPWAGRNGEQDHLAALVGSLADGGRDALDAGASVTLPSSIGTLRSTRSSTRLPLTSACRACGTRLFIGIGYSYRGQRFERSSGGRRLQADHRTAK